MTEIAMPNAAAPESPKKGKKAHSTPWRDNIEAMLMAIIMALVLKYFLVEAYRIPTGSMQPTLIGNDHVGVYDRILVDKFSYQFKKPERFDVAVFRYPLDRSKNFVKRIVGVGPEDFRVRYGDLWHRKDSSEEWKIIHRPAHVQAETWLKMAKDEPDNPLFHDASDRGLKFGRDFTLAKSERLRFGESRSSVLDSYNDGYPDSLKDDMPRNKNGSGAHPVGDLRIDGSLEASAETKWITFEITEGALKYNLKLPGPAAPADAQPTIEVRDGDALHKSRPVELQEDAPAQRLEAGKSYDFVAQNLDDMLTLELDGDILAQLDIPPNPLLGAALYIETDGGPTTFEDVMVYRDIFYTNDNALVAETHIPEGMYFMMGDNTLDSSDSRMWRLHRLEHRLPDGSVELVQGNHRVGNGVGSQSDFKNDINPMTTSLGTPDLRPITWFRDEWGEMHQFEAGETAPANPLTITSPYVREDQILGRAIAVFWPIRPFDGIWRFKKVD